MTPQRYLTLFTTFGHGPPQMFEKKCAIFRATPLRVACSVDVVRVHYDRRKRTEDVDWDSCWWKAVRVRTAARGDRVAGGNISRVRLRLKPVFSWPMWHSVGTGSSRDSARHTCNFQDSKFG